MQEACNRSWLYSSLQVPRPAPSLSGAEPLNPGRREPARERLLQNSKSPRRWRYPPLPTPPRPQRGGPANTPQSWSPAPPRPPGGRIHPDASPLPHSDSLQPEFAAHAQVLDFHVSSHLVLHCLPDVFFAQNPRLSLPRVLAIPHRSIFFSVCRPGLLFVTVCNLTPPSFTLRCPKAGLLPMQASSTLFLPIFLSTCNTCIFFSFLETRIRH